MRNIRILAAGLLAAASLSVVAVPPAAALTAHNLITMEGSGSDVGFGADYLVDDAHGSLTSAAGPNSFQFVGTLTGGGDSDHSLTINVNWAGTTLTVGTSYTLAQPPQAGQVGMSFFTDTGFCYAGSGSILIQDLGTGVFGADYSGVTCASNSSTTAPTLSGVLRWGSSVGFQAVDVSPRSWDFGNQPTKVISAQPQKITFTNDSQTSVGFGPVSLSNTTAFGIKAGTNGCSGHTVAAGGRCSITVLAHPQTAGSPRANLILQSTTAGVRDRFVKLTVEASNEVTTYAAAGPERVHLHWRQLPAPINAVVNHYRILRGTTLNGMQPLRNVTRSCCPVDVYDTNVHSGTTYYYAVQPAFSTGTGSLGVPTPAVAAIPWPKFSAGMYHKAHPFRLVSDRVVHAGQPVSLPVLGQHGLPGSGVTAVAIDILAGNASSSTQVRVYPTGSGQPAVADVAVPAGGTRTNFEIAALGRNGHITVATSHGSTSITIDVTGYFSGSNLSHTYGQGGAVFQYLKSGTIMDTKSFHIGALKHGYYVNCPVNFTSDQTPHVTSLLVEVTAYGATAPGTITAFATNTRPSNTVALAYGAGGSWSNTTIVAAGRWQGQSQAYPSPSFLNRGPSPVQLKVTIIGFVDNNYFLSGQRYKPTAPHRLFAGRVGLARQTVRPGTYGDRLTTAFNIKVSATHPTQDTAVSMWAAGLNGAGTAQPQLHSHGDTVSSTLATTGVHNKFFVKNAAGRIALSIWSFGMFDAWPLPARPWYLDGASLVRTSPAAAPLVLPAAIATKAVAGGGGTQP